MVQFLPILSLMPMRNPTGRTIHALVKRIKQQQQVRPRFQGFMMGRITSLEMLQLSKWSSVRGMKGVLQGIRTALETWGRLDLGRYDFFFLFRFEFSVTAFLPVTITRFIFTSLFFFVGSIQYAPSTKTNHSRRGCVEGAFYLFLLQRYSVFI